MARACNRKAKKARPSCEVLESRLLLDSDVLTDSPGQDESSLIPSDISSLDPSSGSPTNPLSLYDSPGDLLSSTVARFFPIGSSSSPMSFAGGSLPYLLSDSEFSLGSLLSPSSGSPTNPLSLYDSPGDQFSSAGALFDVVAVRVVAVRLAT